MENIEGIKEIPKFEKERGEGVAPGSTIEADAVELAKAAAEFKRTNGRHPNTSEVFRLIKKLGWKKEPTNETENGTDAQHL